MSVNGSLQLYKNIMSRMKTVDVMAHGISMFPFIRNGDLCRFAAVEESQLRPGDVLLIMSGEGRLIGHRLMKIDRDQPKPRYWLKGDNNLQYDDLIHMEQILGRLIEIYRGGRTIRADRLMARLMGRLRVRLTFLARISRKAAYYRVRGKPGDFNNR